MVLQRNAKNFDLGPSFGWEVDGVGRKFVFPDNSGDFGLKKILGGSVSFIVKIFFGDNTVDFSVFWEGYHLTTRKVMSSKSSRPEISLVRAVVPPAWKRLSMSRSDLTVMILRMELERSSE